MRLMSDVLAVSKTLPQVQFIVKRYLMGFVNLCREKTGREDASQHATTKKCLSGTPRAGKTAGQQKRGPSTLRVSFRPFPQPTPPKPLDPLVVHPPPFPSQHRRDPPVTVSPVLTGQIHHPGHQLSFFFGNLSDSSLGRSCLSQYSASPTLGDSLRSESLSDPHHGSSLLRRA